MIMPRIFPEALPAKLQQGLAAGYLLTGQDLLLVNEAKAAIIHTARQQAFEEKIELAVDAQTKWDDLFEQVQSVGLFSQRQLLLLNLPESLTAAQQQSLDRLLRLQHSDLLIILHAPKFAKTMEKQAWYGQASGRFVQVNCQTPDAAKLPTWLSFRAKTMGLQLENEALHRLCFAYEGNLPALQQALLMLQLRFPDGKINVPRVQEIMEQSAQFTQFQWVDALLEGKISRAIRILAQLRAADFEPIRLLRTVQTELMLLLEMTRAPQPIVLKQPLFAGNLRHEFDRLKVWQNRRGFYQQAVQRLTYAQLFALVQQLAEIERKIKRDFSDDVWLELERFSLLFSQ